VFETERAVPKCHCPVDESAFAHVVDGKAAGAGHEVGVITNAIFVLVVGTLRPGTTATITITIFALA
jgi:hypothetical protein